MDHHDHVKPLTKRQRAVVNDRPKLPLEPVAHHCPFQAPARPQADARLGTLIREDTDGQRRATGPSAASVHGAEGLGMLEWCRQGGRDDRAEFRLGRDELPAAFPSTTTERASSAAGPHALQKPVDLLSFPVRLVGEVLFHGSARFALYESHFIESRRNRLSDPADVGIMADVSSDPTAILPV